MRTKKIFGAIIAVVLVMAMLAGAVGAAEYTESADDLKSLGLFLGTDVGYELDREPARAEAAALLVRLLGKESELFEQNYSHPFTDVPKWADPYVGYLYENNLTKGMSGDKFGPVDLCDGQMFCTFVLRALGYTEDDGDFTYDESVEFATGLGLIDEDLDISIFTRGDCVAIMLNALMTNIKGIETTLLDKLVNDGAVDEEAAKNFMITVLVREMNILSASSFIANTNRAYSVDFEEVTYWDRITGTINVIGDDYAVFLKFDNYPDTLAEYRKDGYVYNTLIDRDFPGMEWKIKYQAEDLSYIPYMFIYDDSGASDYIMTNIEKIISDEDETVTYKYVSVLEESLYGRIEESGILTFDNTGELIYASFDVIYEKFSHYYKQYQYILTGTGDDVKIDFPDFSDYKEY